MHHFTLVVASGYPSDSNLVPLCDQAIDGELNLTEGCLRAYPITQ